jgi:hypothetical protein
VIDTEHQREATMSWMRYWTESLTAGEQSWQGHEEALEARMQLRTQIEEYDRRPGAHRDVDVA